MSDKSIGHYSLRRILDKISPEILETFTGEQLLALTQACDIIGTTSHAVDIRVSIPLPYKPFYVVFLMGPERRSNARLQQTTQPENAYGTYLANRILDNVGISVRQTLTRTQRDALYQACTWVRRKAHAVDLKFSIPCPGTNWYLILWAGPERRSPARLRQSRRALGIRAVTAAGILLGYAILGGILYAKQIATPTISQKPVLTKQSSAHPVTVPFKHTRTECQTSGREWRDNQCFDYEHNPVF